MRLPTQPHEVTGIATALLSDESLFIDAPALSSAASAPRGSDAVRIKGVLAWCPPLDLTEY